MSVIGVDVGGTSIKGARFADGTLVAAGARPTPAAGGADSVVTAITDVVAELRDGAVEAVGVAVPGTVDAGVVRFAANLALRDVDLHTRLEAALGLPVVVGHDVTAAAEAEAAATACTDLFFVALGTGVAGAHVRAGVAARGATGQAAEVGHVVVVPGGEPCGCGSRGCVEAYASARSIGRRYREMTGMSDADARHVASVLDTDRLARAVWQEAVDALAAGLASAVALLDPALLIVGGGLAEAGELLLEPLRKSLDATFTWRPCPPVRRSALGADAGQHGAVRLALQLVQDREKERSA